jgi:hypothetical protein
MWCRERAHKEYDYYKEHEPEAAVRNAVTSMLSDLGKHEETANMQTIAFALGLPIMQSGDERQLFAFLDGFN